MGAPVGSAGGREGGNGAHVAAMPSFLPLLAPHSAASEGEVVGARKRRSRDEQFILYLISSDRSRRRRRTRLVSACLPARVCRSEVWLEKGRGEREEGRRP